MIHSETVQRLAERKRQCCAQFIFTYSKAWLREKSKFSQYIQVDLKGEMA